MMPKSDTIASIIKLNPTANPTFLSEFPPYDLEAYLSRLQRRKEIEAHPVDIRRRLGLALGAVRRPSRLTEA